MLRFSDHFTRTAVISLPARAERRAGLQGHLAACGIDPGSVSFVEACDGAREQPPEGWGAGGGAWGCLQSHLRVLTTALEDGVESVLVLEDDVVFHPHTARVLPEFLRAVPSGWSQIYLGGQHLKPARPAGSPLVVIPSNVNRTHAYAVSRAGLPAVISWLSRTQDFLRPGWHLDHQFGAAHQDALWPVFAPSWWLAGQNACASDICGSTLPQRWWHPRRWAFHLPFFTTQPADPPEPEGLHFGAAPAGLDTCPLPSALAFLHSTAAEALDLGRLPALRPASPQTLLRLRGLWPAGFREWLPGTEAATHYPFNGLFPHPFARLCLS